MKIVAEESVFTTLIEFGINNMIPTMLAFFAIGLVLRTILYYTMKREEAFSKEFEKRMEKFIKDEQPQSDHSLFQLSKKMLETTYYEVFELRSMHKRRKPDIIMSLSDRLFMIQHGCARLTRDVLKRIKVIKFETAREHFTEIAKNAFERNASFSKLLGVIPATGANDFLHILPGIFIVSGILGTFLGIVSALPEFGGVDFSDAKAAQEQIDLFLMRISFSMHSSIVGIVLSVVMTVINTTFDVEKVYVKTVERFSSTLSLIWNLSDRNTMEESNDDYSMVASNAISEFLDGKSINEKEDEEDIDQEKEAA